MTATALMVAVATWWWWTGQPMAWLPALSAPLCLVGHLTGDWVASNRLGANAQASALIKGLCGLAGMLGLLSFWAALGLAAFRAGQIAVQTFL